MQQHCRIGCAHTHAHTYTQLNTQHLRSRSRSSKHRGLQLHAHIIHCFHADCKTAPSLRQRAKHGCIRGRLECVLHCGQSQPNTARKVCAAVVCACVKVKAASCLAPRATAVQLRPWGAQSTGDDRLCGVAVV